MVLKIPLQGSALTCESQGRLGFAAVRNCKDNEADPSQLRWLIHAVAGVPMGKIFIDNIVTEPTTQEPWTIDQLRNALTPAARRPAIFSLCRKAP